MSTVKKGNADLPRNYILAPLPETPWCRFCFRDGPEAKLTRISDDPTLRDFINEQLSSPPSLDEVIEEERPDWFCGFCRRALTSARNLKERAAMAQLYLKESVSMESGEMDAQIELDGSSSRKRPRAVDMATVLMTPVRQKHTVLKQRDLLEASSVRLNFSSCVLTPPRKDDEEELYDEKRVPDILTKTFVDELSSCSSSVARTISDEDFPITLLDPSNPCAHCRLLFATGQQVGWHTRVHSGRGPLRCRFCPQKLQKVSVYIRHVARQHAAIRRAQCELCDESFNGTVRAVHEQHHERTRMKYACSFCPLIFNRYKKLRQHRQQMHNDWRLMCRNRCEVTTDE